MGQVIDAKTGEGLSGATAVLAPLPEGVLGNRGASPWLPSGLTATTTDDGGYAFHGLSAGSYALLVSRIDYKPARLDIELTGARAHVSVGLVVDPIVMEPREVLVRSSTDPRSPETPSFGAMDRLAVEKARQARFLESDVRSLSEGEVREAVTLAEIDLFRALQRLPGVSTRDDYTAELWTRGAPWSHTRVYFDGIPLFNPLHGIGMFGAVNPDAVGAAFFHPGGRSSRFGEGAAAVLDVASRPASGAGELRGQAEVSLLSARGALDRASMSGRGGWMVAGRRSYLDLMSLVIEKVGGQPDLHVPYDFHDLTGRLDLLLGDEVALEASALWEQDAVRGEIPDAPEAHRSRWGNAAARVTLGMPLTDLRVSHTLGASHFYARGLTSAPETEGTTESLFSFPWENPTESTIDYLTLSGELSPGASETRERWSVGYSLVTQRQRYDGPAPTPHPGRTSLRRVTMEEEVDLLSVWAERRIALNDRLELEGGLRVDAGTYLTNGGRSRLAPRVSARYRLGASPAYLSVGYLRGHQYAQTVAPAGLSVGPRLHPSHFWLLAGDSLPAIRSDVVTVGAESWLAGGWLLSTTAYRRFAEGIALPPPEPGVVPEDEDFVVGSQGAHGLEVSLRRMTGEWTGSLAYTLARSTLHADGWTFPAPSDRRHTLDAALMGGLGERLRVGSALTWSSGAPFTRFFPADIDCDFEAERCTILELARVEKPGAERTPAYASLDALVEWTTTRDTWDLTVYGQLRNLLARRNAITYRGSRLLCEDGAVEGNCEGGRFDDEFDRGLPLLPAVGLRVSF